MLCFVYLQLLCVSCVCVFTFVSCLCQFAHQMCLCSLFPGFCEAVVGVESNENACVSFSLFSH